MSTDTFAIVGAGLAGAKAAETLREEGFDGRLVLLGAEPEPPYERPPLSKEYLRGEGEKPYVHEAGFYADHDIELRVGERVVSLDPGRRELALDSGERLAYDRLLLATGAAPRRPPIPGAHLGGVHHLRTIADSDALRARLQAGRRLVVVGAGWIGCEVAASARQRGVEVTVVAPESVPLERVLGLEVGRSTATSTRATASTSGSAPPWPRSRGTAPSSACSRVTAARSNAMPWSSAPARSRAPSSPPRPVSPSTTACSWTAASRRACRGSSRPATSPTTCIRGSAGCGSSTGTTRCTRVPRRRAACSAPPRATTACRTSSPISTTSGWSTRATRRRGTACASAATPRRASSSPSGSRATASSPR